MRILAATFLLCCLAVGNAAAGSTSKAAELTARAREALKAGNNEEALELITEAGKHMSGPPTALVVRLRGLANERLGNYEAALADFTAAARDKHETVEVRVDGFLDRSRTYQKMGEFAKAKNDYVAALALSPESSVVLNDYAWFLATTQDEKLVDGEQALVLVQKARKVMGKPHPAVLDTLAASYAAAGQFPQAIKYGEEAIALSTKEDLTRKLEARLKLYEAGQRFVERNP